MSKRRLGFMLALGVVLGLLVTACGAVAINPTGSSSAASPSIFGPMVDSLNLPALDFAVAPNAQVHAMRSMALQRAVEAATQSQYFSYGPGGGCPGRSHDTTDTQPQDDGF